MILRLVDLPWYDVIYRHIFIRLDLRDLCNLRCLSSTEYRVLVDNYIATWDTLDISSYTDFEPNSFEVQSIGVRQQQGYRVLHHTSYYNMHNSSKHSLLARRSLFFVLFFVSFRFVSLPFFLCIYFLLFFVFVHFASFRNLAFF